MLKSERHELILNRVEQFGKVIVSDLTEELAVTEDTIRKDLQELSKAGLVKRVHGGAIRIDNSATTFEKRIQTNSTRKKELGKLALQFIQPDQIIYIDSGTTNLSFANEIPLSFKGTIITNSPSIGLSLSDHPYIRIRILPGELNKESKVIEGSDTIAAIRNINFDLCFLGVSSIDINKGITVPMMEESLLKQQVLKQSSHVISIITSEKIGTTSTYFVDKSSAIDAIITEGNVPENLLTPYKEKGIQIVY